YPIEPSPHVATCSPLAFSSNPPSSGNHYGVWAQFRSYQKVIPRGFWVHSMEHGAVVLLHNCPDGCADDVVRLQQLIDAFPADPLCTGSGGPTRRLILVADPKLGSRFGAAAWGHTLTADCLDPATLESLGAFMTAHYAQGPENFCTSGVDYETVEVPAGCGEPCYVPPTP
ncbi:MAG: DUF3105 domain-containing protein, partial [Myxococcales bacterium]